MTQAQLSAEPLVLCCLIICLCSEFRVVMSVTISAYSVCRYHQLFVGGLMSYLCYCICLHIVVSNTYCAVFLFYFTASCVPYVASFSGESIFYCPFGIIF